MPRRILFFAFLVSLGGCAEKALKYNVSAKFENEQFLERSYCQAPEDSLDWDCFTERCASGSDRCDPVSGNAAIRNAYQEYYKKNSRAPADDGATGNHLEDLKQACTLSDKIESCAEYYENIQIDKFRTNEAAIVHYRLCHDSRIRCDEKNTRQKIKVAPIAGCNLATVRALPLSRPAGSGFQIVGLGADAPDKACEPIFGQIHKQRKNVVDSPLKHGEKILVRREEWKLEFPKNNPKNKKNGNSGSILTRVERIILRPLSAPKPASNN